jgi:hypothetical protein
MSETLKIRVTQDHINYAEANRHSTDDEYCGRCVVAVAVREALHPDATVGTLCVFVRDNDTLPSIFFALDGAAQRLIREFDAYRPISPCTITLTSKGNHNE